VFVTALLLLLLLTVSQMAAEGTLAHSSTVRLAVLFDSTLDCVRWWLQCHH
jgi:hypothetical protein